MSTAKPNRIIPFQYSGTELEEMFIKWIISFEDSPIDSAAADIVSFVPVLYPAYQFIFKYNAKWSATSIWEHDESYTEYESKTFFVDKHGY
ncbi:MAG: hypothetical protein J5851_01095, partial [Oscillospiraceae bacterium]|nr:hypothetical protein [Oscillospiraceae bacterium]